MTANSQIYASSTILQKYSRSVKHCKTLVSNYLIAQLFKKTQVAKCRYTQVNYEKCATYTD